MVQALRPILIPRDFFKGLALVMSRSAVGHESYFLGEWAQQGWWYYFPVILILKSPMAFIVMLGWSLIKCGCQFRLMGVYERTCWLASGKLLRLVPICGYDTGLAAAKFLILPVLIGVVSGIGASVRLYRALFLEEINKDYVRTARAKGLGEAAVMLGHVLRNALIPILTGIVVVLPLLFLGSLLTESFFGIPGLGSYTIDAIDMQDFAIVRVMVFLGSVLYILGLVLTDISYTLVDPRVRLA